MRKDDDDKPAQAANFPMVDGAIKTLTSAAENISSLARKLPSEAIDRLAIAYLYLEQKTEDVRIYSRKELQPYMHARFFRHPQAFYGPVAAGGPMRLRQLRERSTSALYDFSFPSPHPQGEEENHTVYGRLFLLPRRAPCVVILHGWRMRTYLALNFIARQFLRAGLHAAFMELPFHFRRRPPKTFSGEKMITLDAVRTIENLRQAVQDARTLVHHLNGLERVERTGLFGVSLGGWLTALCVAVEPALAFAIMVSPAADPGKMFYESLAVEVIKKGVPQVESFFERIEQAFRVVTPASFRPAIPKKDLLIVEATHDLFVPPQIVETLWEAWDRPELLRFPHGHLSLMADPRLYTEIQRFLEARLG